MMSRSSVSNKADFESVFRTWAKAAVVGGVLFSVFRPFTAAFAQVLNTDSKSALFDTELRLIIMPPMSPASRPSTARPITAPVWESRASSTMVALPASGA